MEKTNGEQSSYLVAAGRQAGVCLHISSLPGQYGVGDIADSALSFLDQLVEMKLGVWQYLPTGPTAYGDSPYQPLSAFAGNEMLLGLNPLVQIGLLSSRDLEPLKKLPVDYVDYGQLIPVKRALLKKAAQTFIDQPDHELRPEYKEFLGRNGKVWLNDYALFRVLKTIHDQRPWPEWDPCFVHREPAALKAIKDSHCESIDEILVTQFLFARQWRDLKIAARQKGICLFGDMPIYIAQDSADAWSHPELLLINKDGQPAQVAGVPPDYFSEDGQLWGNPIYDWDYHRKTDYHWWVQRMEHATSQNDLVRIDHFRGFEAYWSVPFEAETARTGEWVAGPGDELFEAIKKSLGKLPIVAEDLGVITPPVEALRRNHGMPGMVVLQFEVGNTDFDIAKVEVNSVCYTGTHDNDTTVGWFLGTGQDTRGEEEVLATQKTVLQKSGGTLQTIHLDMIRLAFSSQAALAVAPMQDFLGLGSEARLNTPGTTTDNWRWRMQSGQLGEQQIVTVRQLVQQSLRQPEASGLLTSC